MQPKPEAKGLNRVRQLAAAEKALSRAMRHLESLGKISLVTRVDRIRLLLKKQ